MRFLKPGYYPKFNVETAASLPFSVPFRKCSTSGAHVEESELHAKPVSTSHIFILATANALECFGKEREEDGVDRAYAGSWIHNQLRPCHPVSEAKQSLRKNVLIKN